jgi:hypothetical protein
MQVKQRISAPRPGQGVVSMLSRPRGARFTVAREEDGVHPAVTTTRNPGNVG